MTFAEDLFVGESVKNTFRLKRKIMRHEKKLTEYVIILSLNPTSQLEILKAGFLAQTYYYHNPPVIVGLAGNYNEAVDLVVSITEKCFRAKGNANIKEYFSCGT